MFKVENEGKIFYFEFDHFPPKLERISRFMETYGPGAPTASGSAGTSCRILSGPAGSLKKECSEIAAAHAILYFKDTFSRTKGRKYSLAKVLRKYPKTFRTQVWAAYAASGMHLE